jgi:hypothetical protein
MNLLRWTRIALIFALLIPAAALAETDIRIPVVF